MQGKTRDQFPYLYLNLPLLYNVTQMSSVRLTTCHLLTHQSHDVIGQVPSQVRGHETGKASKGNACVILVRTAEVLEDTIWRTTSHLRSGKTKIYYKRKRNVNTSQLPPNKIDKQCMTNLPDLIGCQHDDISALVKALRGSQVANPL